MRALLSLPDFFYFYIQTVANYSTVGLLQGAGVGEDVCFTFSVKQMSLELKLFISRLHMNVNYICM